MTQAEAEKAVKDLHDQFVANANNKNIKALVKDLYAANAVLTPPGAAANKQGKDIKQFWDDLINTIGAVNFTRNISSVQTSGNFVLEIGDLGYSRPGGKGKPVRTGRKCIVMYRSTPGGLKAVLTTMRTPHETNVKIQMQIISGVNTVTYDIEDGHGGQKHQHVPASISNDDSVTFIPQDGDYWLTSQDFNEFDGALGSGPYGNCQQFQKVFKGQSYTIHPTSDTVNPAPWFATPFSPLAKMKKLLAAAQRKHGKGNGTGTGGGSGCCVCIQE